MTIGQLFIVIYTSIILLFIMITFVFEPNKCYTTRMVLYFHENFGLLILMVHSADLMALWYVNTSLFTCDKLPLNILSVRHTLKY